jgi:hypothetical protein
MRSTMFVPTLIATLLAGLTTGSIRAQGTGPITFYVGESALSGAVACNGGQATPMAPVDASTSNGNGGLNDASASSLSADACGLPLYTVQSAQDASYTGDTGSSDVGNGGNGLEQVSLLGGVLTFQAKTEYDFCGASASGNAAIINCQDNTQIQDLVFAGQPVTGTYTQPTTINADDVQVQLPGYCTGIALFNGSLTINSASQQQSDDAGSIDMAPVALNGTLTCVGLPLGSTTVNLRDENLMKYRLSASYAVTTENAFVTVLGNGVPPLFNAQTVANPNQ